MNPTEFIEILNRPLADLPHELEMLPLPGPFNVEIRPPGSKSLTNRALLLAALAQGESVITGALIDADDAQVMIEALRQLGAEITIENGSNPWNPDRKEGGSRGDQRNSETVPASLRIRGTAGRLRGNRTLNLKNAGTATRFLTAAACLADGPVIIDGNERMRQRPIGELVSMLRQLGVTIDELGEPGCVPLRVHPLNGTATTDTLKIGSTASSQFVSAVLMIAPLLPRGLFVEITEALTSPSYVDMTLAIMDEWLRGGVDGSSVGSLNLFPSTYRGRSFSIEPDASGAAYFWSAAALVDGSSCEVPGLDDGSGQGDARVPQVLRLAGALAHATPPVRKTGSHIDGVIPRFIGRLLFGDPSHRQRAMMVQNGALRAIAADFTNLPDAAMTLAAVACFAEGTTTITGLRTLRVKETDRLAAMQTELSKLGVRVEIFQTLSPPPPLPAGEVRACPPRRESSRTEGAKATPDEGLRITPPPGGIDCSPAAPRIVFDTYDDHRMAMSLALIGLRRPNIVIRDPACVAKTYPTFWKHLSLLYKSAIAGGEHVSSEQT